MHLLFYAGQPLTDYIDQSELLFGANILKEQSQYEEAEAFAGRNTGHLMEVFEKFEGNNPAPIVFSWAGFFFAPFWLLYRRMYKILLIFFAVALTDVIFSIVMEELGYLRFVEIWESATRYVYGLVVGLFGNKWLHNRYVRTKQEAQTATQDRDEQLKILRERGGTNLKGVFIVIAVIIAIIALVVLVSPPE